MPYFRFLFLWMEWQKYQQSWNKTFFIEEFSMIPNKWMTKIYEAFTMFKNKIYMFGDPNQCEPVEPGSQIHHNYLESKTVSEMCPDIQTLKYIEKSCRYDKQTHEMLKKLLKYGKISTYFQPIDNKLYKNICYLNSTRIKVNTECCKRFIEENNRRYITIDFKYNNKKENYPVCTLYSQHKISKTDKFLIRWSS